MEIPKTLKDLLNAHKVIPFVGAGVSRSVACKADPEKPLFPSWKELLLAAAERIEREEYKKDADYVRSSLELDPPKYMEAADHARKILRSMWYEVLKEQLGRQADEADEDSLALAKAIWNLGSKLIITTNYDRVLKWSCPIQQDFTFWDIQAPVEQQHALRDGVRSPTVWHLHGQIDNTLDLILTPDGYSLLYPESGDGKSKYQAALRTLQTLFVSHSMLFIGCSMDDLNLVGEMRKVHDIFEGAPGPHYVIARQDQEQRIKQIVPEIEVLTFSDFGQPLLDLLNELAEGIPHVKATEVSGSRPSYDPLNRVFYVPYRRKGDQVIGREKAMKDVRQRLTTGRYTSIGHAAAFDGIGGLGKTQLAIEYAYQFHDQYPNGVIWLNADQDIGAQLVQIAVAANWVAPGCEHKVKYEVALHRLKSYSDCLIIFDNLEDEATIEEYLPDPNAKPHILATSRSGHHRFSPVPIDPLKEDDSLALLIQEAGRTPDRDEEIDAARKVAFDLAGLPLALELAGACMRRRRTMTWVQYRKLLHDGLLKALDGRFLDSFTHHDRDLFATLTIDEAIFNEEPRLRDVLNVLTWSARASMGLSLLCALLNTTNEIEIVPALALGVELRLLTKHTEAERYELHPLVLEVRRKQHPLRNLTRWADAVAGRLGNWFETHRKNFTDLPQFEAEIDHLQAWLENAQQITPRHAARLAWLQAYPPYYRGRSGVTQRLFEDAVLQTLSVLPGGRRRKEPRSILVTRHGNVVDIIVALPAFHALRRLYPNAKITLLTSPTNRGAPGALEVLKNDKTFNDIIVYYVDDAVSSTFLRDLGGTLYELDIDIAICLPNQLTSFSNLLKYMCLFSAAGIRRFVGFHCVTPPDYKIRQVDRLMRIINQLGPAEVEPFPWIQPSAADIALAEALIAPAQSRPVVAMHCGAKRPANRWAPESFIEIGKRFIAECGAAVVLMGGLGEAELTARVAAGIGAGCIDLTGKTELGVLVAIAQKCTVVISNDTEIMHVAYAAGAPVVGIFSGRYFPEIWYPYGDHHAILRRPIECQYCGYETCAFYSYPKCLELITPEEVFQAAARYLQ